ncbi:MAG: hypothetical protein J1F39_03440 [Clostridiales bacterium]|nr:hypothetical protein [Clostridiales bacterium]
MKGSKKFTRLPLFVMVAIVALFASLEYARSETIIAKAESSVQYNTTNEIESGDFGGVVFDYRAVFAAYYADAKERYEVDGSEFIEFETFCDNYYLSGMDIFNYTESYFDNPISFYSSSGSSASSDANYILSKNKYDCTPASEFDRKPLYTQYLYSSLQNGDLICETDTIMDIGHTAVVTDINHDSDYGKYCQTIEAVAGGVQYGFLDDDRVVSFGVIVYRARGFSQNKHSQLLEFLEKQLGKNYSLDIFRQNKSIDSTKWYCSELAWAAFNYVGIDIGQLNGTPLGGSGNSGGCLPITIEMSDNTYRVNIQGMQYLRISIVSKSGTTWSIKITNNNYFAIDNAKYNERMCFEDDAKRLNIRHEKNIPTTIPRFSSVTVSIKEYLFATCVVCYWEDVSSGITYITYGKELNKNTKSMDVKYVYLE